MANRPGTSGNDYLVGTEEADLFTGGFGDDMMVGKGGDDTFLLQGSAGWDDFYGDAGNDTILVDQVQGYWNFIAIQINSMSSIEKIQNNSSLPVHIYARYSLDLSNTPQLINISEIRGQATGDYITGNLQDNFIFGNDGADKLTGLGGNDKLNGGLGNDTLIGGAGNDLLYGEAGTDQFQFGTNDGTDTIYDFQDGMDKIAIASGTTYTSGTDGSGTTYIDIGLTRVMLNGVPLSAIDGSDFLYI